MVSYELDEPSMIWRVPVDERWGGHLLVLMHGAGGVEQELAASFPDLPQRVVTVAVRAPVPTNGRWSWATSTMGEEAERFDPSVQAVSSWLDRLDGYASVGLLGFSQGAAVALQLLRHFPHRFAYCVQLAGFVPSAAHPGDAELARLRPPVFSGRGEQDDVIPAALVQRTAHWLRGHTTLTERRYSTLGHEVSGQIRPAVAAFVGGHLPA